MEYNPLLILEILLQMVNIHKANLDNLTFCYYLKLRGGRYKVVFIDNKRARVVVYEDKEGNKVQFYEPLLRKIKKVETEFPDDYITTITHSREQFNKQQKIKLI